ncbi:hypothetical protein BJ742DRAFT_788532 [Cladochytrium replicatum]|nr:hypothetical protein BJ742DRAFT_788532 [Cladochytrium replicatum]
MGNCLFLNTDQPFNNRTERLQEPSGYSRYQSVTAVHELPPPSDECICARMLATFNCHCAPRNSRLANASSLQSLYSVARGLLSLNCHCASRNSTLANASCLQSLFSVAFGLLCLKQPNACSQLPPLSWDYNSYFEKSLRFATLMGTLALDRGQWTNEQKGA